MHLLSSDAHGIGMCDAELLEAFGAVRDDRLAHYLTTEAPAAIVAGDPLPTRPAEKSRRLGFRRR